MYNKICPPGSTQYVVKSGDTFWNLSQAYGVSVQSIVNLNPGVDPLNLQIGSMLCIPYPTAPSAPPMTQVPAAPLPVVSCPDGAFSYTIQSGDTLWKLSQAYGVSVQSIVNLNPGVDPLNLQIGSMLCIPYPTAPSAPPMTQVPAAPLPVVSCPDGAFSYTIQSGDTLWKLSQAYGVSVQSIANLNPGVDPQNLQIGSILCIPYPTVPSAPSTAQVPAAPLPVVSCPDGAFSYTIQSGDTLWKLSQAYGVSVQSIANLNPGVDPQNLQIGSILCIPYPTVPSAPSTAPLTAPSAAPLAPPRTFLYLVKKCDSICTIARKFYVSAESILKKNPGLNPRCLQAGTYIYVPINCCGENTCRYTVRAGDTLNQIANKFNVCPSALIAANPNIDFQHLAKCQMICIPLA